MLNLKAVFILFRRNIGPLKPWKYTYPVGYIFNLTVCYPPIFCKYETLLYPTVQLKCSADKWRQSKPTKSNLPCSTFCDNPIYWTDIKLCLAFFYILHRIYGTTKVNFYLQICRQLSFRNPIVNILRVVMHLNTNVKSKKLVFRNMRKVISGSIKESNI